MMQNDIIAPFPIWRGITFVAWFGIYFTRPLDKFNATKHPSHENEKVKTPL